MKNIFFVTLLSVLFFNLACLAQSDSLRFEEKQGNNAFLRVAAVPISVFATGIIMDKSSIKKPIQNEVQNSLNGFRTKVDDYIQYAPIAQMYLADIAGIKSKHNAWVQTKYLIISELITGGICHTLKRVTYHQRPDGTKYSFPSGHTSQSFVAATVLFEEFKETNRPLAYSGFLFSTATGVLRVANNKHWVSDVLTGAGIGIVVTELVYHLKPFKNRRTGKQKKLVVLPKVTDGIGVYMSFKL